MPTGNAIQGAAATGAAGAAGGGLSGTYPNPVVVVDSTASDVQPDGTQAAGAAGLPADAGHVHQEKAWQSLLIAPTGSLGETFPVDVINTTGVGQTSGTLIVSAVALQKGVVVSNITLMTGGTPESGGTHGWYCLLDSGLVVRAVSGDQTGAAFWGANSAVTLAMGSPYTVPSSGLYYVGVCVTATQRPTFLTAPALALTAVTPVRAATSSTGQTTPPSVGATMGALTGTTNNRFYAYVS